MFVADLNRIHLINNTCRNKTSLFIFPAEHEIYRRRVLSWHGQNIKRFRARKLVGQRPECTTMQGGCGRDTRVGRARPAAKFSGESPLDVFGSLWQTLVTVARSLTADRDDVSLYPPPPSMPPQIIHYNTTLDVVSTRPRSRHCLRTVFVLRAKPVQ